MTDEIVLTLPRDPRFYDIAHLVIGGLGARADLTLDHLDDLHLALDGLLPREDNDSEITVVLRVRDGAIVTSVGPLDSEVVQRELGNGREIGLRRVLETVADRVELSERDGAHWVELTKDFKR
jgi:hypothetical protein